MNQDISGFTNMSGFPKDEQETFFDRNNVTGNLNNSEMNFTLEEMES
jgi:hypothetical protein